MMFQRSVRHARMLAGGLLGALAATALTAGTAAPAGADTPYTPWSEYLPGWTSEFIPTSANDCVSGKENCIKQTLKELARIFDPTVQTCDHDAVFAHAYLRITQTYVWTRDTPGYYEDVPFANHQDAVFAKYYTDAYTNFHDGNLGEVPQSWRVAFEAARDKQVSATGDLLLGMNAHINRDLAFVVAAVGLVAPDGSSRKPDYDKVEEFLNEATVPMLAEAAARLDPTLDDAHDETGAGYWTTFQAISAWRENAWRNAEALVSASTEAERAQVAARIEAQANAVAQGILLNYSHLPGQSSQVRDAYCAVHHDDAAPMAYPFGTPEPYGYH